MKFRYWIIWTAVSLGLAGLPYPVDVIGTLCFVGMLISLLASIVEKSLMGLRNLKAERRLKRNHERIKSEWGMPSRQRRILDRVLRFFEELGKGQFPHK